MNLKKTIGLATIGLSLIFAGSAFADNYLVVAKGKKVSARLAASLESNGGSIVNRIPQIGILVVESDNPDFASLVEGAAAVVADFSVSRPQTKNVDLSGFNVNAIPQPPFTGDDDFFFDLQWGHTAVRAQEAWAAGQRGAGARVFILDEGFDLDHPDLAPNFNLGLATSFVPGEPTADYLLGDTFSHGSHTSGTIGAADNAFGTIGVAPEAELVPVKVLSELLGGGAFSWIINGIVYAADNGADVINMSLGTLIFQGQGPVSNQVAALRVAVNKAITYAYQNGATVVVSGGNDFLDLNSPGTAGLINFNGFASHAISVSATGPNGWALDPFTDLNVPAYYTNIGPEIDFAAPGGTIDFPLANSGLICGIAGTVVPCYVYDFVFSVGNGGWYWSIGTSMAAPHVAGLAALLVGANGGDMHPADVKAALRDNAVDLGKPGGDDIYGHGAATSGF